MDFKRAIIFSVLMALSMITAQVQAAYSHQKPICCVSSPSTMHGYVDISLGKAFHTHLPSSNYDLVFKSDDKVDSLNFSLSPQEKFYKNNLFMELGLSWSQSFLRKSPYFSAVSLGLRYQVHNLNEQTTAMGLRISNNGMITPPKSDDDEGDEENKIGKIFSLSTNPQEFIFSQNSLLMTFKLNLYRCGCLMPYINGGFGTTWHKVIQKNALDQQVNGISLARYLADYRRNKEFTYSAGIGVDFLVTENFWLSFGYQYNYYGDITVNSNFIGVTPAGQERLDDFKHDLYKENSNNSCFKPFQFNNLSTQTVQLTGRYVFG